VNITRVSAKPSDAPFTQRTYAGNPAPPRWPTRTAPRSCPSTTPPASSSAT